MRRVLFIGTLLIGSVSSGRVAPARFEPLRAAAPLYSDGLGKEALEHLARGEHERCARALQALVEHEGKKARPETRLLLGVCELRAGNASDALATFDALGDKLPLLADYARLWSSKALLSLGRNDEAATRAATVTEGSPLAADALLTRATSLDRAGKAAEAASAYAEYAEHYPKSWTIGDVRAQEAAALDRAGKADEARAVWRQVYIETPLSHGKDAEPHLDATKPLTAEELARRAMVLFDAMKNHDSELAWGAVLSASDVTPALSCRAKYHLAQSVWKARDRARSAPLFEAAAEACIAAKDDDLSAKSLYQAGRAHGSRAEKDPVAGAKAISLYEQLMTKYPAHSYADDAALRRADVLDTLNRRDEGTAALAELPEKFPTGDQRGEALFRLGFRAFERADAADAQHWFERELALLPREEGWWEAGRTLYWLGRCRAAQDDNEHAATYYARALREYPLSYYALMAANRLLGKAPADAGQLLAELSWDAAKAVPPTIVDDQPVFHQPAFERAILLLRMGLGAEARRELSAAGLEVPRKGVVLPADPRARELGWVASMLFEAAGDYAASHAWGRYVDLDYANRWPKDADELRWRMSFPRAFASLVEENVKKTGQPAALELAIMREESAFDPNLESFANAIGLTQLTAPPAERFAQGLPHDGRALRDPAINVAIGARELGALYALFDGNAALTIAGYNAGEGAVKRWLRDPDNQNRALDEFIERIPYDETRGYTKRVLGTFFAYRWLERTTPSPTSRVPRVNFALPRAKRR